MSELRYHPFLDQWVITATHRQERTFLPPPDYCPLCPTRPGGFPTEIPEPDYDIAVFENKFPSLRSPAPEPAVAGMELTPVRPSDGICEVVCYTSRHDASLADLPYSRVRRLTRVWRERYRELSARPEVEYVFIFENKGAVVGVTLHHPHGQIYAYPFIPPVPRQELAAEARHVAAFGRPLMAAVIEQERESGARLVWESDGWIAWVPFFARYPYEVWLAPVEQRRSLAAMSPTDLDGLAEGLLVIARTYDRLFGFSLPYVMFMHQEPAVAGYEFAWFHVEFQPPHRTADKLKFLAGSEAGAGAFINDTLPEQTAARLREVLVRDVRDEG